MVELTDQPIDVAAVVKATETPKAGGHVHFVGTVRGDLKGLFYECYPSMALRLLQTLVEEAKGKWPVEKVAIVHRHGWVPLGEASVVIAVSAAHREEAYAASRFLIDRIKEEVPIWKEKSDLSPSLSFRHPTGGQVAKERVALRLSKGRVRSDNITGVILAGGHSSRFGSDKALALFGSGSKRGTLIERVAQAMRAVFQKVMVSTNSPEKFKFLGLPTVEDVEPHQGPLGGIVSVFQRAKIDKIFVTACDLPLLNEELIRKIVEKGKNPPVALPIHGEVREYLMGLYSRNLLPEMIAYLEKGGRSLEGLLRERKDVVWIPVAEEACYNVNTCRDLEALR